MRCYTFGFLLLFCLIYTISYLEYQKGGKSLFFRDITKIEHLKRENQLSIEQLKNKELKELLKKI